MRAPVPGDRLHISDARRLRALAEPARLAIMQLLSVRGPRTATQLAQDLGLTPSLASYHLRELAAAGFVAAQAHPDRRQRPWRVVEPDFTLDSEPGAGDPQADGAIRKVEASMMQRNSEVLTAFSQHRHEYSAQWRRAVFIAQNTLAMTPSSLTSFAGELTSLVDKYRQAPPADDGGETELVLIHLSCVPWRPRSCGQQPGQQ
jgi:DNA-binding transcriptional ArsR family regulator